MQTYGIAIIPDGHGNTIASATVLSGTNIGASGVVTTRADVDVFQFSTGSGNVTINFNPAPRGPNLDIQATLTDANGNMVAIVNPAGLAASYSGTLAAGVYYIRVDGTGAGDLTTGYSDYASLGQYSISGTLVGSNPQPPTVVANGRNVAGRAVITVRDANGAVRPGVTVAARWSGLTTDTDTGVTDANGQVVFLSNNTKKRGTFTVIVTNLSAAGYTYNSSRNVETSDSIVN